MRKSLRDKHHPSNIASMLLNNEIDIGLAPVAIIPAMKTHHLVSDYCIGTTGEVASVCLFSDVPLENIETILLDYQSRTSSALLKLLLNKFWMIEPRLEQTSEEYRHRIQGSTAGLVIGDRAFDQRKISHYIYDLGLAWKSFTSLPFVFAAWISNKPIQDGFINKFNEANKMGLNSIPLIVKSQNFEKYDLSKYYNTNLSYQLDEPKLEGLAHFLSLIST